MFEFLTTWLEQLHTTFIASNGYKMILQGLGNTIIITVCSLIIGVVLGSILAIAKYFNNEGGIFKVLAKIADIYTTIIRGIPVVVLLLIFYFIILKSSSGLVVAIVCFGINSGAYVAEVIRSGLNAVNPGQMEAARSLGMSKIQAMYKIIFPQAVRYIIPAVFNEFIALVKETSVAGYVAIMDLTRAGNLIRNSQFDAFNPLMLVALTYLLIVILLTQIMKFIERKLSKYDKRPRHH